MKSKAIIEIPEGSLEKIEIKDGVPKIDRILTIPNPVAYGFIPDTLAEDGDALDIFVISNKLLNTSDEVEVKIVGAFKCTDQGVIDNKLVAVMSNEKTDDLTILKNLAQIGDYLLNYKPGFVINGYINYNPDVYFWKKLERTKI